jgi:hypothetical protein
MSLGRSSFIPISKNFSCTFPKTGESIRSTDSGNFKKTTAFYEEDVSDTDKMDQSNASWMSRRETFDDTPGSRGLEARHLLDVWPRWGMAARWSY